MPLAINNCSAGLDAAGLGWKHQVLASLEWTGGLCGPTSRPRSQATNLFDQLSPQGIERRIQIAQQVIDRLQSNAEADQIARDFIARTGGTCMGHPSWVFDETFDGTEALGQCEKAGPRAELNRGLLATSQGEADHAAEGPHLSPSDLVTRVLRK